MPGRPILWKSRTEKLVVEKIVLRFFGFFPY